MTNSKRSDLPPTDPEQADRHPIAAAAWKGYAEYRAEMRKRRMIPAWREMSVGTMAKIALVLVALFLVLDGISYLKE